MHTSTTNEASQFYAELLGSFLAAFLRAEKLGKLDDPVQFSGWLKLCFEKNILPVAELAEDEKISRAAISKWMHGLATPAPPTRKTVVNWIKEKAQLLLEKGGDVPTVTPPIRPKADKKKNTVRTHRHPTIVT